MLSSSFQGILLYMLRECTEKQRAKAVAEMRRSVREQFPDIRLREDIQRHLWEFISEQADKFDTGFYLDDAAPIKTKKPPTKKRARAVDGDEAEYAPKKAARGRPKKSQ